MGKKAKQPLEFDICLGFDIRRAAATDNCADTIDYDEVAEVLIRVVQSAHFELIERIAEEVTQAILECFPIEWIELEVRKPRAIPAAKTTGVRIKRQRGIHAVA
ncbi:dihydroneopterin aldolase [Piscirickettsia litoralis]|uniref:dihydroneopterin aldolase n=1 Tax=Piscirickettsia litoralis TaxID=1891921 RepID=UPI000981E752|nr:dihydroneopterin aldolase [Piscirickettsia litoralis]